MVAHAKGVAVAGCQHIKCRQGQVAEAIRGDGAQASAGSTSVMGVKDSFKLQACQWWVKRDHYWSSWGLDILAMKHSLKVRGQSLSCGTNQGLGWAQEVPEVGRACLKKAG